MDLIESQKKPQRHPWELSRLEFIKSKLSISSNFVVADVDAGDHFFLQNIGECSKKYAIDIFYKDEIEEQSFIQKNNIDNIPKTSVDLIFLLNIIEHVVDDLEFLNQVKEKVKVDGEIVITVPAFQTLFTNHDVFLKHFRRYNHFQLLKCLKKTDLEVLDFHNFYFSLLTPRVIEKVIESLQNADDKKGIGSWSFSPNHLITYLIKMTLNIDASICAFLNKFKIKVPELSLYAKCRVK